MASPTPGDTLDALFPIPKLSEGDLAPVLSPGHSSYSAKTLVNLLKDNHDRFHIFFNDRGFHNHATHHLHAIYALGAPPDVLEAAYKTHVEYQRPAYNSPGDITESNWTDHLEDQSYYRAYLKFFSKVVLENGTEATLEKYVFSTSANWVEGVKGDKKQPQMVNRLLSGVLHPLIHAGHALEFGSPGMLVEGLAMACATHSTDFDALLPKSLFVSDQTSTLSRLTSALSLSAKHAKGVHTFTIVARMLKDPELAPGTACFVPTQRPQTFAGEGENEAMFPLQDTLAKRGALIRKYANEWTVNVNDKEEVKAKAEELFFLVTMLYGIGGLQEGQEFIADFFLMHLVTSSLFLPSYLAHISPSAQSTLLSAYLAAALAVWVARGRPALSIASFYARTSPSLTPPGPLPTPSPETLTPDAPTPSAWLPVLQSTLLHPNEHLPKAQRALAHFARAYGGRPAGVWAGTELEGAEKVDGTLFVRAAGLTMDRLGWLREGKEKGEWDFTGFWERGG